MVNKRYLIAAIVSTVVTVVYYVLMTPVWREWNGSHKTKQTVSSAKSSVAAKQQSKSVKQESKKEAPPKYGSRTASKTTISKVVPYIKARVNTYVLLNGSKVEIPEDVDAEFRSANGTYKRVNRFKVEGTVYEIADDEISEFLSDFPSAERVIRMELMSDGYRDYTQAELDGIPKSAYAQAVKYPMPSNAYFIIRPQGKCDSTLKINTSIGVNYVVKVAEARSGKTVLVYFLPAGSSHKINIPSGAFEIRYTCGTTWYGEKSLFGPSASYSKADRVFDFRWGTGYELTLYRVPYGNLNTSEIREEDF